jgi:beta-lactamase class A
MGDTLNLKIDDILDNIDGKWGMVVKSLVDGRMIYQLNPDEWFPSASIAKVFVGLFVFNQIQQGLVDDKERIKYISEMKMGGSGILQHLDFGVELSLSDVVKLMLIVSDNTCAKILIKKFTPQKINEYLESIGLITTRLKIDGEEFGYGLTTPNEMANILEGIYKGRYLNQKYSKIFIEIMKKCDSKLGIRRFLPNDPHILENNLEIANKGGNIPGVRNDVGMVFSPQPYVITILSKDIDDKSNKPDNKGRFTIAQISLAVYEFLTK